MLTEKQIYTRMDKCYYKCCDGRKFEDIDEWWGEDTCEVWSWNRPSPKGIGLGVSMRMVIDPETEIITIYGWDKEVSSVKELNNSEATYVKEVEKGEYWS